MGSNGHYLSKKALRDIDIPPRKLLGRRAAAAYSQDHIDLYSDSPRSDERKFQKFLPCNNGDSDSDEDPYSSDEFRMFEFKVRRCSRSRSHDWTDCPFAHPGEKARRRDPRRFHYTGNVCPDFRRGNCSRGDNCDLSHGVFECWLHPTRYRTEACKDGKNCKRKVCFFAHTSRQLRVLPLNCNDDNSSNSPTNSTKVRNCNHCCVYCHSVASPTSTLMGFPHFSPTNSPPRPRSPAKTQFSPVSRFGNRLGCGNNSYKEVTELMSKLAAMNVNESPHPNFTKTQNLNCNPPWVDVNFNNGDEQQHQQQFVMSPSTPNPFVMSTSTPNPSGSVNFFNGDEKFGEYGFTGPDPDLGWVNDLLT